MNTEATERKEDRQAVTAWLELAYLVNWTKRAGAERLRPWNLSPAQFDVIAQVGANEELAQQNLAERLLSTQGNISQLLNGMEKRGLIHRRVAGRSNRLSLTGEGRALYHELVPYQEAWHAERFAVLSSEEQSELLRLLRKLEPTHR